MVLIILQADSSSWVQRNPIAIVKSLNLNFAAFHSFTLQISFGRVNPLQHRDFIVLVGAAIKLAKVKQVNALQLFVPQLKQNLMKGAVVQLH